MDWLTVTSDIPTYWPLCPFDVEDEGDAAELTALLAVAQAQCEAFAPALAEGDVVPERYRMAQAMQARALQRSGTVGSGDQFGAEGFTVTIWPMDWTVKALLRPAGKPVVG